jgi:phosphatidylserine/phosphatidylglycerophosphate/cardiolipin synthase-like enzyme
MIEKAPPGSTVDMAYFIYENDYSSSYMTERIIARTREGVKFRIVVDDFMAEKFPDVFRYLASEPNILVYRFRPATRQFMEFLTERLKMTKAEDFVRGLSLMNKDMILQAAASSPILAKNLEILNRFLAMKNAGTKPSEEEQQQFGLELATLMLHQLQAKDTREIGSLFQAHLIEFTRKLHHKVMISTSTEGNTRIIVGGRNISDEYDLTKGHSLLADRNYPFFDLEVSGEIDGAAALDFRKSFEGLLARSTLLKPVTPDQTVDLSSIKKVTADNAKTFSLHLKEIQDRARSGVLSAGDASPDFVYAENKARARFSQKAIAQDWLKIINSSEKSIRIITAYFYFSPDILKAIEAAARRGVKIEIYTNSFTSTDMNMVNLASYMKLLEWQKKFHGNVQIFELQLGAREGSLHAKAIVVDDSVLGIGSANADPRTRNLDTNGVIFMDVSQLQSFSSGILAAFIHPTGLFQLPWALVTPEYAQKWLGIVKEKRAWLLRLLKIDEIIDQL